MHAHDNTYVVACSLIQGGKLVNSKWHVNKPQTLAKLQGPITPISSKLTMYGFFLNENLILVPCYEFNRPEKHYKSLFSTKQSSVIKWIRTNRVPLGKLRPELLHLVGLDGVPDQAVGEEVPGVLHTPVPALTLGLCFTHNVYEMTAWTDTG